jgi:phosphoribosyl-ATP pyrophosphohydrolase
MAFRAAGFFEDLTVSNPTTAPAARALPDVPVTDARVLDALAATIHARATAGPDSPEAAASYTRTLLAAGPRKIHRKLIEEAFEVATALDDAPGDKARLVSEAADLVYHLWVLFEAEGVAPAALYAELGRRFGLSGLEEKAARQAK